MTSSTAASRGARWSLTNLSEQLGASSVRWRGDESFMALCPCHSDSTASLSVTWSSQVGGVLLYCHGCQASAAEVVDALGMGLADLFDEPVKSAAGLVGRSTQSRRTGKRRGKLGRLPAQISAEREELDHAWTTTQNYSYRDDSGQVVQEVLRQECACNGQLHKTFKQRFRDPHGTWVNQKPARFSPVLYRQDAIGPAVAAGIPVWVLEGEKDVHTAEQLGLVATTNAMGAGSFPDACAEKLTGAHVRVVLDRDGGGWARGVQLVDLLKDVAASTQLLIPAVTTAKADFSDHVEAGKWISTTEFGGLVPVRPDEVATHSALATTCSKRDLVATAAQQVDAQLERATQATKPADAETARTRSKRWAVETERRAEAVQDAMKAVLEHAVRSGTRWAEEAAHAAQDAWQETVDIARRAHLAAGVAIPPLLQEAADDLAQEGAKEAAPGPDRPAAQPSSRASSSHGSATGPTPFVNADLRHDGAGVALVAPNYRIFQGNLVEVSTDKEGSTRVKAVLTIDARILEMEYLEAVDDTDVDSPTLFGREHLQEQVNLNPAAPEELSAVIIGYTHPDTGEFMKLRIGAQEYRDCTWVESLPGPPQYDSKPSGIAKLRDALKGAAAGQIVRTIRYRSTGWRRDDEGQWFFVHAGGAINGDGARVAPVLLTGPLARFDLPAPTTSATALREAFVDHSGAMLTSLPARISAPLLGHVFRSAMGPNPWVLTLVGSPGSFKTSLASLAMHHWGEKWDRRHPASSMSGNGDTLNALRIKLNAAKDALYWADDVAPTRDWGAAQKALEEFARMVHNGEQRSRSTRDGQGVLDGTAPRSSALVTSEVMPRPGSGAQRQLVVPLSANDIDLDTLIAFDGERSRYGRALVMASFLQWLAPQLDQIKITVKAEVQQFAEELRQSAHGVRESEAAGNCWAGWYVMAQFLLDRGAITVDEYGQMLATCKDAIIEAVDAATDPDLPTRTGARVRELLSYALRSGLAYVDDVRTGECPDWPLAGRLGWRRMGMGTDGIERGRTDPRGIRLGWVMLDPSDRDGGQRQLLVESAAIEAVLKAAGSTMADAPQIDRGTALRAMNDEEMLIVENRKGLPPRFTVQRTIHCEDRRCRVTVILLDRLLGTEDPDDPTSDGDNGQPPTGPDDGQPATLFDPDFVPTEAGDDPSEVAHEDTNCLTAGLHSPEPTTQSLTSSDSSKEEPMPGFLPDAEGVLGEHVHFNPPRPCVTCGDACVVAVNGVAIHVTCWQRSTAAQRRGELPARPAPAPAAADKTVVPAVAKVPPARKIDTPAAADPTSTPSATWSAKGNRPNPGDRQKFTAPAAIAHIDGIWLPNGERVDLPATIAHVGDLAELVDRLRLGTAVTKRWAAPGQIWVTEPLSAQLGITPAGLSDVPDFGKRRKTVAEHTTNAPFVADALAAGWQVGGKDGDRLSSWTRVWRGQARGVWVVLMAAMDPAETPVLEGDPTPAAVARRLALFAAALDMPWALTNQSTGVDLMKSVRGADRAKVFAPSTPVEPAQRPNVESDISWCRTPTEDEQQQLYVHGYDRGGSHIAGVAGLELGIGDPTPYRDGFEFDKRLPGYWLVDPGEAGDWRYPHPLNPQGRTVSEPIWVTTPSLEVAIELGYEPKVLHAYVWHEHGRILDSWYTRIGEARTFLDSDDPDAQIARDLLKTCYTRTVGMLGSNQFMEGREGYAPERRHHIIAKARANIMRRVVQIGNDSGQWPVAISNDTIVYVSNNPDPIDAWPGDPKHWGRRFGQYKWEGSALLSDHVQYLDGGRYRAKEVLSKENWLSQAGE